MNPLRGALFRRGRLAKGRQSADALGCGGMTPLGFWFGETCLPDAKRRHVCALQGRSSGRCRGGCASCPECGGGSASRREPAWRAGRNATRTSQVCALLFTTPISHSTIEWPGILGVVSLPQALFILETDDLAHVIPSRAFSNQEEMKTFAAAIESRTQLPRIIPLPQHTAG